MDSEQVIRAVDDIPSYILEDDIRLYHKYMSQLKDGSEVLDIGTGLAKSAIALALSNPEVMVITVDNGIYPIERNWAAGNEDYKLNMLKSFSEHGVNNIRFYLTDILDGENSLADLLKIALFQLDGEKETEGRILRKIFPLIEKDGIMLIRNYDRFKDEVDDICKGCEYLEQRGKIQVIKKV